MGIALNVGRSRMNLLSIALALYLFSIGVYVSLGRDSEVAAVWVFLTSFVPIVVGFALTLLSLMLFLACQRLDPTGNCEVWTFSVGELLMYLAMAQTLSGGLQNFVTAIAAALSGVPQAVLMGPAESAEFKALATSLYFLLQAACGLTWGGLIYVAPVVFIRRTPLPRQRKWILGAGYVVSLLIVFWISAYPYQLKARAAGKSTTMTYFFARQVWQPALWRQGIPDLAALQNTRGRDRPSETSLDGE